MVVLAPRQATQSIITEPCRGIRLAHISVNRTVGEPCERLKIVNDGYLILSRAFPSRAQLLVLCLVDFLNFLLFTQQAQDGLLSFLHGTKPEDTVRSRLVLLLISSRDKEQQKDPIC